MKHILFFIIIFVISTSSSCQTVHESYLDIIKTKCPSPDITEVEKKSGYTEIEYLCEGKIYEIILDDQNRIISYETEADEIQLTEQVYKKLNRNYPGWQIDEYSLIYFNDTSIIKVEVIKNGIEQNVYFTLSGKLYKPKSFHEAQKWNSELFKNKPLSNSISYDITNPHIIYDMPELLNEISGIAILDPSNILCIQDEIGSAFHYNLEQESIVRSYRFSDIGDYEDIAFHDGKVYVLRSDGTLTSFIMSDFPGSIKQQNIAFQSLNIEGLFYDRNTKSMLFACNESNITSDENRKDVYYYDLKTQKKPVLFLSVVVDSVVNRLKQLYPELNNLIIDFSPSAVAVHPLSDNIYILSANDRMLVICNREGKIIQVCPLPSDYFYKPEGIAFLPDGTMLISNEGTKNGLVKANILSFKYRN